MTSWPPPADELASSPLLRATGPDLVAIGGGHGLSIVLAAARSYAQRVTGVVTVADDGGSSGRLTTALDIPPPGDMRRGLLALSPDDTVWRRLFEYRFTDTDVAGHSMGNLILAALTELMGDFEEALLASGYLLGARGRIVPVACQSLQLSARIDHEIVSGQVAVAQHRGEVQELILEPNVAANPVVIQAIAMADQIVLGPGSLFTSVLSCLSVDGIAEAIDASRAELVYVMNLTTQDGETWDMSGIDHLQALVEFAGIERGGTILAHQGLVDAPSSVAILEIDDAEAGRHGWKVHGADLFRADVEWPEHDPAKLISALSSLA